METTITMTHYPGKQDSQIKSSLKHIIQCKAEKEIREALSPLNENGGEVEKKPHQNINIY